MADGSFFCATLAGRRRGPTAFVHTGAERPHTRAKAVKQGPCSSWERRSAGLGACVGNEGAESCGVVRPLRIPLVIRSVRRTHFVLWLLSDELLCGGYKWVS